MKYCAVQEVRSKTNIIGVASRKRQHFFISLLLCLICLSSFGLAAKDNGKISHYIKRITNRWVPKEEDIGKIKFVNFSFVENKKDGVFIVSSPFKNYYANNLSPTSLEVFGLGDPVVLSPIDAVIEKIELKDGLYNICLVCDDVTVLIKNIDFVCASLGDKIKKGQQLAVSFDSRIVFELMFKSSYIELPAAGVNQTFFE